MGISFLYERVVRKSTNMNPENGWTEQDVRSTLNRRISSVREFSRRVSAKDRSKMAIKSDYDALRYIIRNDENLSQRLMPLCK